MNMMLFVIGIGLFLGIALGAYVKLLYSIQAVVREWRIVLNFAVAKRQSLLVLAKFAVTSESALNQEISCLTQLNSVSWRYFLKNSHDIIPFFAEMEERSSHEVKNILLVLNNHTNSKNILPYLETFWAKENLFAFAVTHYERAIDKYLEQRAQLLIWPFSQLFRFSLVPNIKILPN